MAQQISIEDAFPIYRQRCSELFDENLVLRAQISVLEGQNSALTQEKTDAEQRASAAEQRADQLLADNEQLRTHTAGQAQPLSCIEPDALQ